jgi:hypothetical protein
MSGMKRALIAVLIAIAITLVAISKYFHQPISPPPRQPVAPAPASAHSEQAMPEAPIVEFRSDGPNEKLLRVNEGVVGAGNVRVAIRKKGEATYVLVLTPGTGKYYVLDGDLTVNELPGLSGAGFQVPPPPIVQTMSIFRALTKREMNYSGERGDRIIILVCPKEDWATLKLQWPR